jgi:hypothetical protein
LHDILAILLLLYGFEIWTLKQRDVRRLKTVEMKLMRLRAGYTLLDHEVERKVVLVL